MIPTRESLLQNAHVPVYGLAISPVVDDVLRGKKLKRVL
jgi:hypothetical protein